MQPGALDRPVDGVAIDVDEQGRDVGTDDRGRGIFQWRAVGFLLCRQHADRGFELIEGYGFLAAFGIFLQGSKPDVGLTGIGGEVGLDDLVLIQRDPARGLVDQRVRAELDNAESGFAIGSGGFDGSAGIEGVAIPTVELRLIHGESGLAAGNHLRPCRRAARSVFRRRGGGCPSVANDQQAQHQHR